jgi:cytochrome c-type biogenesis protein CcmH/NrfG
MDEKLREWEYEQSLPYAAEVIGAALVLGQPAKAFSAAKYVISHSDEASKALVDSAMRVLDTKQGEPSRSEIGKDSLSALVREMKALVRLAPQNAFAWVEMARAYISLGLHEQSTKAIQMALALGGENRHVLRSAARLFTHLSDPSRAHRILTRADSTPFDPWLIAAEIGAARLSRRAPRFVKEGLRLLDSKQIATFETTELASALATLDSQAGSHRLARRRFRRSLEAPNDNSIAQARWAATHKLIDIEDLDPALLQRPNAFEARAWSAFYAGEWTQALESGKRWLRDQPFSASPAVQASYVATLALEEHEEAIRIAEAGLLANPKNSNLLNNLSYSLAKLGRLDEAENALSRVDRHSLGSADPILISATAGLIAYRRGDAALGQQLYNSAITTAEALGDDRLQAKATLFFALEELRTRSKSAINLTARAINLASRFQDSDFDVMRSRLDDAIREHNSSGPR